MLDLFGNLYEGRRVFLTGHTGFKGSWMALWLAEMGAEVTGFALPPETQPNHFELLNMSIRSILGDVRDAAKLNDAIAQTSPEIIFHMAAQALVRRSYAEPLPTFETNVMGTVNLFEACRKNKNVRAIVNITSDKCYENREWIWGYRENDPMGGYDPYSASKGCSELVTASWRNSFFNLAEYCKSHQTLMASARAGNVIGGGDWSEDRLLPDIIRSITSKNTMSIRNPHATRPWQYVLEPISGYLLLGKKLLEGKKAFADAWNFGPPPECTISVGEIVRCVKAHWDTFAYEVKSDLKKPHEAGLLSLDCSKAHKKLNWKPVLGSETTIEKTLLWYRKYIEFGSIMSRQDLIEYTNQARCMGLEWTR